LSARAGPASAPLRLQLLLLLAVALAVPGAFAVREAIQGYRAQVDDLEDGLANTARLAASEHVKVFAAARDLLRSLAAQPAVLASRRPACRLALDRAISGLEQFVSAIVVDAHGRVSCASSGSETGVDLEERQWVRDIMAGRQFVVSDLLTSRVADGVQGIAVARGIVGVAGQPVGAVALLVGLENFASMYVDEPLPTDSAFALLDGVGNVLSAESAARQPAMRLPAADLYRDVLAKSHGATFRANGRDGVRRVYVIAPLLEDRLSVLLGVPTSTVLNPLTRQFWQRVLTPVLMWVLATAVLWFGLDFLVIRWVRYLERITSMYAAGRHSVRPERIAAAPAELRSLGETFGRMADLIDARERELRDSLDQKDLLVREIHHRVKNNLQLVMSLLNLHGRRVRDPRAEQAFTEVRDRITALATLHRRLYESEALDVVDLRWFLEDLCAELRKGGYRGRVPVRLNTDLPSAPLSSEAAVPLGLLVTEAITNAYKHAFQDSSPGIIELTARFEGEDLIVTVADNGVGAAEPETGSGLGRSLMESFAMQLGGQLTTESKGGLQVSVRFPRRGRR
jgi:two-component sensor histidine kinase